MTSSVQDTNLIAETIDKLKRAIWAKRPILGEIMQKHGDKFLFDYAKDFMDVNKSPFLDARKPELIECVAKLIEARLGKEVAEGVSKQLRKLPLVSTTDHHGPIQHPFFLNSNIISALPYPENDPDMKYLVVLSFASVSVNNASCYPRGILFHGENDGSGGLIRLPILPDKLKMGVVYASRAYTRDDLDKAEIELSKKEKSGEIAPGRGEKIRGLMEKYFATDLVMNAPDLNQQITEINFSMWPDFFHGGEDSSSSNQTMQKPADLIYLEIETLVTEMLLEKHLKDSSSLIHKFLFDPKYIELAHKHFNNIPGAFSIENDWGTYMFWGMDEKLHRIRLTLKDGQLTSGHGSWNYDFTPEGIAEALRTKKIFPGMLLCYLMVSLYYGMKCLGGFCQVSDLTRTKDAWSALLKEVGENEEAETLTPIQTKELGGDGMVLSYLHTKSGEAIPAMGIDMILSNENTSYHNYAELSKKVTLSEMMAPMLPEMYTVLYPIQDRDPNLLTVTPEAISKETKLVEKLVA